MCADLLSLFLREIKFERQRSEKKQFHFMYAKEKIHAEKKLKGIFVTKRMRDKFKHFDCFFRVSKKKKTQRSKRQEIMKNRFILRSNSHIHFDLITA